MIHRIPPGTRDILPAEMGELRRLQGALSGDHPPFRLSYFANAYRAIRPQRGQMREFAQAGVELIGVEAPGGTAEVIEVLSAALDAAGLTRAVIGLGDAYLYRQVLAEMDVSEGRRGRILAALAAHDLVGLEREVDDLELAPA